MLSLAVEVNCLLTARAVMMVIQVKSAARASSTGLLSSPASPECHYRPSMPAGAPAPGPWQGRVDTLPASEGLCSGALGWQGGHTVAWKSWESIMTVQFTWHSVVCVWVCVCVCTWHLQFLYPERMECVH